MNYYEKYVKYKSKYLALIDKNSIQIGGDVPTISHPDRINFFTDAHMAQYLNPIYGLVMYKCGFISNTFHLHNSEFIDTPISKIIKKSCKIEPSGIIKPTNEIMQKIKPIDFGRYIAIKYINMMTGIIKSTEVKVIFIDAIQHNKVLGGKLLTYINKLNKFIPITVKDDVNYNEEIYFHIILYCMWWTAYNDDGITQYYNGINEVFSIIIQFGTRYNQYINIDIANPPNNNFESQLIAMTHEAFKIYNLDWPRHFCKNPSPSRRGYETTYPDCGEVTARNLINLLCFDGRKFDIEILNKFKLNPKLIEYYTNFDTFEKQSIVNKSSDTELDARDSWSQLIIFHAARNIKFNIVCNDNSGDGGGGSKSESTFRFEVNSGLAMDNNKTNFLQLIQNLLGIENWADLKELQIEDNIDSKGIGKLNIRHKNFGEFIIHCQDGHYSMKALNKATFEINYNDLDKKQIDTINKLLRKDGTDYMWIKFDSELFVRYLSSPVDSELKLNLLKLSMTDQFDSDARRRIAIDTDASYFNDFVNMGKDDKLLHKLEEYTYKSRNFDFMNNPLIAHLHLYIRIHPDIFEIDLSPLSNLTKIGDAFLGECYRLTSIDLSPLSQLTTIGRHFLSSCKSLEAINLSPLSKLTTIGDAFLSTCTSLKAINLSPLSKLTTIGEGFLSNCASLKAIDLSPLSKLTTISNSFLYNCSRLEAIDLPTLTNITAIANGFLSNCASLKAIDLSPLSKLTTIADLFLYNCSSLESIDLSQLSKLTTIGDSFLSGCRSLEAIDLSPLSKLTTIGYSFLRDCSWLESIDLSQLSKLTTIADFFLYDCTRLTTVDLSGLSQLTNIGSYFLNRCPNLHTVLCDQEQYELIKNSLVNKDILRIKKI